MTVEVGVRDLRANLSRWLARVRKGEEIVVTDRGKPVARIVSASSTSRMDQLVAEGLITLPKRPKGPAPRPIKIKGGGSITDVLLEQRRR